MRILARGNSLTDSVAFYRINPFDDIPHIDFQRWDPERPCTHSDLTRYDILFMSRPCQPKDLALLDYARKCGLKIWVDHDDDLFNIPEDNPAYGKYTPQVHRTILEIASQADVLTTSTAYLKKVFFSLFAKLKVAHFPEMRVIPNAIRDRFLKLPNRLIPRDSSKIVLWRGSQTHEQDLWTVRKAVLAAAPKMKEEGFKFVFLGYNPWFITTLMERELWEYHTDVDPIIYLSNICHLIPAIGIYPLTDQLFNFSKSNIAWLEYTLAGAKTIAPKIDEFDKPGVQTYSTADEFYLHLMNSMDNLEQCKASQALSYDHILKNYIGSVVNEERINILTLLQ